MHLSCDNPHNNPIRQGNIISVLEIGGLRKKGLPKATKLVHRRSEIQTREFPVAISPSSVPALNAFIEYSAYAGGGGWFLGRTLYALLKQILKTLIIK